MSKLFGLDSPVVAFLTKIANFAILSLLYSLCCIPVFTIGAATTAMYSVVIQFLKEQDASVIKCFFGSFRKDFRKSTILFLIIAPLIGIVVLNVMFITGYIPGFPTLVKIGIGIVTLLLLACIECVFPLVAQFENTVKGTLKNAFLITLMYLPQSISAVLMGLSPIAIMLILNLDIVQAMIYWTFCVVAIGAYLRMRTLRDIFKKFMPPEQDA